MQYDIEQIHHLIRNRRSMYPVQYTGEKIDDRIVEEILENARWAPTHKLTQPWSFTVFTGKGLEKLSEFQSTLYKKLTPTEQYSEQKFQGLIDKPLMASHVISIGMRRNEIVPYEEEVASVACAVQNMYLTANAYGLGCYWGSGGITYMEEAKEFFDLNTEDRLLGFFFIGVLKGEKPTGSRQNLTDKVKWVSE